MPGMQRNSVRNLFQVGGDNPALFFSRGLAEWPEGATERGEELAKFIQRVAGRPAPPVYADAFNRWYDLTADTTCFACWIGKVDGRLFLGLGGAHVLETNLTLSRPYGVPLIPGSSLKGLAHAHAKATGLDADSRKVLFGQGGDKPEDDQAGYLIFHDAWWVPDPARTPFAREVVTVHHQDYYTDQGEKTSATDFDSPNPNVQLAARGSFLFVVEGACSWSDLGLTILRDALMTVGVGGKVAAGYGYFEDDSETGERLIEAAGARQEARRKRQEEQEIQRLPPAERLRRTVEGWDAKTLAGKFGKNWNKTAAEYGNDFSAVCELVREIHHRLLTEWVGSPNQNERKAYKKLHSRES